MPSNTKLTLQEFCHLIKTLNIADVVPLHKRYTRHQDGIIQLPSEVTQAFLQFEKALSSKDIAFKSPEQAFRYFLRLLVNSARANTVRPNTENECSAYLVGFLLHHHLSIQVTDMADPMELLILEQFPYPEKSKLQVSYSLNNNSLEGSHRFLSHFWRCSQNYLSLETLEQVWLHYVKSLEQEEQQKALLRAQQEAELAAQQQLQAQYREWRQKYFFDENVLDLNTFSYVLEAFMRLNIIAFPQNEMTSFFQVKLAPEIAQCMLAFSQAARAFLPTDQANAAPLFVQLMKMVIHCAKNNHDENASACQYLLGFLMFHNFKFAHQGQVFQMADIFGAELSQYEKYYLERGLNPFPYLTSQLEKHSYPSKLDLEKVMQAPAAGFTPGYHHYSQQTQALTCHQQSMQQQAPVSAFAKVR